MDTISDSHCMNNNKSTNEKPYVNTDNIGTVKYVLKNLMGSDNIRP